ncbi:MAG: glycosyltransferase family 4 protein [Candidatus Riflebacteria bacterium]|nr:glycosyltransferase family 4 protein [Candidatus Riflebacteria bacterium]
MKPKIAVITHAFLNPKNPTELNIGGVETWILELVRLLTELGFAPVVYQISEQNFTFNFEGAEVVGLGTLDRPKMSQLSHQDIDSKNIRWIIYASSFIGEKYCRPGQIFIQHGIYWDYTTSERNFFSRWKWEYIRKTLSQIDLGLCRESRLTIAVDTNFLNFARINLGHRFDPKKIRYIPNFAIPQDKALWQGKWNNPKEIKVVFARRFEHRRGVNLFIEALEQVFSSPAKLLVTFAGCGSLSSHLFEKFGGTPWVKIEKIPHNKIYGLLNQSHIAVVPSIYSEGTSFSCLEAMASGCAVIASDVGGLCNIVLPDYNGLLVRPIATEIAFSIESLTEDIHRTETLAKRGYDMASNSFSLSMWRQRVRQALCEVGILNQLM